MTENKFTEVHLFIDESGNLSDPNKEETLLVGGVALFGTYGSDENQVFENIVKKILSEVGGRYPTDLHFNKSPLSNEMRSKLLNLISAEIAGLSSSPYYRLYGLSLRHVTDYHNNDMIFTDESRADNRYVQMLWSLIEYYLFVDNEFSGLLSREAKINIYISTRAFPVNVADKEELERKGFKVKPDVFDKNKYICVLSIHEREIIGMFRTALSQRWNNSKVSVDTIKIVKTNYEQAESLVLLYLADIYLGVVRKSIQGNSLYHEKFIPSFTPIEYGPWLDLLAGMKAALINQDMDAYMENALKYQINHAFNNRYKRVIEAMEAEAASLMKKKPVKLIEYMKEACSVVDSPGTSDEGIKTADLIHRIVNLSGSENIGAEVLYLQACLSQANHTGNVSKAESIWANYERIEPELYKLGAEGLRLMAEMRNRRAVNLTDNFRYGESLDIILKIISDKEMDLYEQAKRFNISREELPSYELGACYGTLGQIYAFLGTEETQKMAIDAFTRAISRFVDPKEIDRSYIYLGHLACDIGEKGRKLWDNAICGRFPALPKMYPVNESGLQYMLHLQVKGHLVFGSKENTAEFLSQWESITDKFNYSLQETSQNPFGLIYQGIAMNYERLWRECNHNEDYATATVQYYRKAAQIMNSGGDLLQLLALIVETRLNLFELQRQPGEKKFEQHLQNAVALLNNHPLSFWGEYIEDCGNNKSASDILERRAKVILSAIKFNFW